jgi:hypothetical protein
VPPREEFVLQVESDATDAAIAVFLEWAQPASLARLLYTPDVLLGLDSTDRRGYLLDEVHWTTIWVERGGDSLLRMLADRLAPGQFTRSSSNEPDPHALLRVAVERGEPVTTKPPHDVRVVRGSPDGDHRTPRAFFLIGDGDVHVEPTLERAAGCMEPIDVRNGEYEAVFDESGRRYDMSVVDEITILIPTNDVDRDELVRLLRQYVPGENLALEPEPFEDPLAVAAAISRREWEHRWPKRPRWLSRRIHGDGPAIKR